MSATQNVLDPVAPAGVAGSSHAFRPLPTLQGDRVSGARKAATMETGLIVQVPLFIEIGESLKIDTRTGEYLTRA